MAQTEDYRYADGVTLAESVLGCDQSTPEDRRINAAYLTGILNRLAEVDGLEYAADQLLDTLREFSMLPAASTEGEA